MQRVNMLELAYLFRSRDLGESITKMVEAAGVEPASEIAVSRETPCSVAFRRFRNVRSERTRCARR
jgi:hypothetical protein